MTAEVLRGGADMKGEKRVWHKVVKTEEGAILTYERAWLPAADGGVIGWTV
jgi:hypothetical protein